MGLFFTILFVATAYLAPDTVFGSLAQYHIEVILAAVTLLVSLLSAAESGILKIPQTYALLGLSAAVTASVVFNGWFGAGPSALMDFMPSILPFWFIYLNCKKKSHLQIVVAVCVLVAFFFLYHAMVAIHSGVAESPYFMNMRADSDAPVYRIRGLSLLNDPNDYSQFMVSLIPLTFFFWVKGKTFRNLILVILPIGGLIFAMSQTKSRGGMLALIAITIFMLRRKIGTLPSVIIGVVIFVSLTAIGFTGGREVSATQGEDRMGAWSAGLQLIREHPLTGVGIHAFSDHYEVTAHNSVVVCAAELGLPGLFFWFLFVVTTVRDAVVGGTDPEEEEKARLKKEKKVFGPPGLAMGAPRVPLRAASAAPAGGSLLLRANGAVPIGPGRIDAVPSVALERGAGGARLSGPPNFAGAASVHTTSDDELRRMSRLAVLSLVGFFAAGWFLSRAYTMILFVNAGMFASLYRMERERGIVPGSMPFPRATKFAAIAAVLGILLVYVILRMDHFFPR